VRYSRGTWPCRPWVGAVLAPLVVGRSSAAAMLAAVGGLAVLALVLVVAGVALGSAFARSTDRRRACLRTLQTLMWLAPWTCHRESRPRSSRSPTRNRQD
jgi:hypothetical protein